MNMMKTWGGVRCGTNFFVGLRGGKQVSEGVKIQNFPENVSAIFRGGGGCKWEQSFQLQLYEGNAPPFRAANANWYRTVIIILIGAYRTGKKDSLLGGGGFKDK